MIRFNLLINPLIKVQAYNSAYLLKSFHPGKFVRTINRPMSIDISKDMLFDPKRHLDYDQLIQKREAGNAILIDVRQPAEINEAGRIPDSINIPLDSLRNALEMSPEEFSKLYSIPKPNTNDEIIFSCQSGRRMPEVEEALGPMPSEEFKRKYGANKPNKNDEIIFTCNTGKRSVKALKLSLTQGYVNSANYKGGWQEWAQKNPE